MNLHIQITQKKLELLPWHRESLHVCMTMGIFWLHICALWAVWDTHTAERNRPDGKYVCVYVCEEGVGCATCCEPPFKQAVQFGLVPQI